MTATFPSGPDVVARLRPRLVNTFAALGVVAVAIDPALLRGFSGDRRYAILLIAASQTEVRVVAVGDRLDVLTEVGMLDYCGWILAEDRGEPVGIWGYQVCRENGAIRMSGRLTQSELATFTGRSR